jgi:hypothetical protein
MKITLKSASIAAIMTLILVQSCKHHEIGSTNITRIPISESNILLKDTFSNYISIDKVIKLETNTDGLIGLTVKVDIADGLVFILSQGPGVQLSLLEFSDEGSFIRRLDKRGKGPGEVSDLSGFYNDSIDKQIYLFDWYNKVIRMDYNGNFLSEFKLPKGAIEMVRLDDRHFAFAARGPNSMYITDLIGKEIKLFKNDLAELNTGSFNPLIRTGNEVLLKLRMNDTLWRVKPDTLVPAYHIDYGEKSLSGEQLLKIPAVGQMGDRTVPDQYMWGTTIRGATADQLCFFIYYDQKTLLSYSDLTNSSSYVFEYKRIINDPVLGKGFYPVGSFQTDSFIGTFMPAHMDLDKIPSVLNSVLPIAVDDNPILVLYRFRGLSGK